MKAKIGLNAEAQPELVGLGLEEPSASGPVTWVAAGTGQQLQTVAKGSQSCQPCQYPRFWPWGTISLDDPDFRTCGICAADHPRKEIDSCLC